MAEYQTDAATKQALSKAPVSSPSSDPGNGEFQKDAATTVPLNRTPITSPSSDPSNGEFQMDAATTVKLNRAAVKGWGSAANIPMSERSVKQSKVG